MVLFPSCENSSNGDLDGFWYMTRMDSIQIGKSVDMHKERKSWSFQHNLMQVYSHNDRYEFKHTIMARFNHAGNRLIVSDPFIYDRMHGDIELTQDSIYRLTPYGINNVPDTFIIETLSDSKMQISDDVIRLYFDKY